MECHFQIIITARVKFQLVVPDQVSGKLYDAKSEYGFIDRGDPIKVIRFENGQVYVVKE